MRRTAATGLGFAGLFLSIVAVLVGSTGLFYMSTAVIATILASRLQAWLAVQHLSFRRIAPPTVTVGERAAVELMVSADSRVRRPLITVKDSLPARMHADQVTPSLPIAPSAQAPTRTQYGFIPRRRGHFRWSGVSVGGMDALGLALILKTYKTDPAELIVWPRAEPIGYEIPHYGGFGYSDEGTTQSQGGIEPAGIREYRQGDPLRQVHWRSTARAGKLLVKDFEAGAASFAAILIQMDSGSELGEAPMTTLDQAAANALFVTEDMDRHGCRPFFPQVEDISEAGSSEVRRQEIKNLLAGIQTDSKANLTESFKEAVRKYGQKAAFYVFASVISDSLASAIAEATSQHMFVQVFWYGHNESDKAVRNPKSGSGSLQAMHYMELNGVKTVHVAEKSRRGQ